MHELLRVVVGGLQRAMHPLAHRRKNATRLSFDNEYDIQDLLHALLRPWIRDIRPEEFTPSHAGHSTRMDLLLFDHHLVLETKLVRDRAHAKKLGDELIIDIAHYRAHPTCKLLWCVVYDPNHYLTNAAGLIRDLEGAHAAGAETVQVSVFVL
ncbi:MAG: hypothetical protein AB7K09_09430 [Planctomycetota bacterium]